MWFEQCMVYMKFNENRQKSAIAWYQSCCRWKIFANIINVSVPGKVRAKCSSTNSIFYPPCMIVLFELGSLFFAQNNTALVFCGWICIPLDRDQESSQLSKLLHFTVKSSALGPESSTVMSSTYIMKGVVLCVLTISLMKALNSKGPNTLPCGTTLNTGRKEDCAPPMHTDWLLLLR